MNNLQIASMKESDLSSVTQIFSDVFNNLGENWSLESAEKHIKENFIGDCHYVAKIEDKIIGFIMAIPLTRERGTELFIDSIAVQQNFQNKGVGKLLLDKVTKYATNHGYVGMRLLANKQLKSFAWYQNINFKESGWVEIYKEL